MSFADGAQAQDESTAVLRRAGLVGVPDDAWIEQRRRFKRILMKKIRTDEAALRLIQFGVRLKCLFHLRSARLEEIEQIPVTAFEIFKHITELPLGSFGIEPKHPVDNMIGPDLVGWIEVAGFSRRLEGSDDDSGRVRAQMQNLAI
jgi:hypothetical protein